MLALARCEIIHLRTPRRKRARVFAPHAEQQHLGDIAEIEADAAPIGPTVLPDLMPDDVGLVSEAPGFHHREPFGQQRIRRPEVKMARLSRGFAHRQRLDFVERQRRVAIEALMFGRDFPRLVLELPRRVGKDGPIPLAVEGTQQIVSGIQHVARISKHDSE